MDDASDFRSYQPVLDPGYRLGWEEREKILPQFDADALERFLAMLPAGMRDEALRAFQPPEPGRLNRQLVSINNAALQAVLDEVWLPYWDGLSDTEMDREPDFIPGRDLARRRRAGREDPPPAG
jgi:hypothetical protein